MTSIKNRLFLCGLLLIVAACKTAPIDVQPASPGTGGNTGGNNGGNTGNGGSGNTGNPGDTALCFERDILPIFISNCAKSGCHDAASRQDGYEFTSYATITAKKFQAGNAQKTELYKKITEDDPRDIMPPPPNPRLSSRQVALIGRWIEEGAVNATGCASLCDSSKKAYAADIRPLLNQYCMGCHSSAAPSGGVALETYSDVRAAALNGRLYGAVAHSPGYSPMPQGGARLNDCTIAQFRAWVQDGAPNN